MSNQVIENILRSSVITGIWIILLFIAYAPGGKILRLLKVDQINRLERIILGLALGLGFIAFGIFILGLIGLFHPIYMIAWIVLFTFWSRDELLPSVKKSPRVLHMLRDTWGKANYQGKGLIIISSFLFITAYIQSLTPAWDADGLMYHMEAPRRFLEAGRIIFIPETYQSNFPMLSEMLFSIGIGLGLDPLAKLIHLTFGVLLILATYAMGERYLGKHNGWLPAAIMISMPMVVQIASLTYIDLIWALYTLLTVYSILIWWQNSQNAWLLIAGTFSGFMIGTKYFAVGWVLIMLVIITWINRKSNIRCRLNHVLLYGSPVILLGSLWYLKNWYLTGNPVYPLFFGGPGMPMERLRISLIFYNNFGTGRQIVDYLLLPVNIYLQQERFMTYLGNLEMPSPLFFVIILFPFVRKKTSYLMMILFISCLGYVYWAAGTLQNRLLMPLFPLLSILSANILIDLSSRLPSKRLQRILLPGILGGLLIFTMIISIKYFITVQPMKYAFGNESRESFLLRLTDQGLIKFRSSTFIKDEMPDEARVLMIWSNHAYYCGGRCIPDSDFSIWPFLYESSTQISHITNNFAEMSVTHLLVNNLLLQNYSLSETFPLSSEFLSQSNIHNESYDFLLNEYLPNCTELIYHDNYERIYEITC